MNRLFASICLVLIISSWAVATSLFNSKSTNRHFGFIRSTSNHVVKTAASSKLFHHRQKHILTPMIAPFLGISILCSSASITHAATFVDPYFQVTFPDNFVVSPKPLKTHEREFLAKSEDTKGYNFGVTVSIN